VAEDGTSEKTGPSKRLCGGANPLKRIDSWLFLVAVDSCFFGFGGEADN